MPLIVLAGGVFVAIVSVTAAAFAFHLSQEQERALARLLPEERRVAPVLPSGALVWAELVKRLGGLTPIDPKAGPRLKRLLVRAGFRDPSAVRVFRGARVLSVAAFVVLGLVASLRSGASAGGLLLSLVGAAMTGRQVPMQYLLLHIRRRKRAIQKGLPNALDLMVICVESGLGLDQTILQVAKELQSAHSEICDEFTVMNLELRAGKRRADALHNLADRTGVDDVKKLVAVLVQTDKFGTSIAQTLRGHSEYMRTMACQRAEERASKLPVKLVFPIFFCILPSLFVVTLGPVVTRLVRDLLPMMQNM
jgi:tight adherence protein C